MNFTAKELNLKDTLYANPHGLDTPFRLEAYSSAQDQAMLLQFLLSNPVCLKVMSTHRHTGELKWSVGKEIESREKTWENTHLLLKEEGFVAGKTGQTLNAGNCLASAYQNRQG